MYIAKLSLQKIGFRRVATFLSSIERNSLKSRYAYQNGLIHSPGFLSQKYPDYDILGRVTPKKEQREYQRWLRSQPTWKRVVIIGGPFVLLIALLIFTLILMSNMS